MSREDVKAEDMVEELRQQFAAHIRECVAGYPAAQALQLADGLCTVWIEALGGMRVTHKSVPAVDGQAIASDWREGLSCVEIMEKHECSRTTAYKHHPSGRRKKSAICP